MLQVPITQIFTNFRHIFVTLNALCYTKLSRIQWHYRYTVKKQKVTNTEYLHEENVYSMYTSKWFIEKKSDINKLNKKECTSKGPT